MQQYEFTNPESGLIEIVDFVKWRWIAHFSDGTKLKQYDDDGIFHRFAEIKARNAQVSHFQMISNLQPDGLMLAIPEGADLIHFYRNLRPAGRSQFERSFIFGWKIKIDGQSVKRIIGIRPDDSLVLMDDDGR